MSCLPFVEEIPFCHPFVRIGFETNQKNRSTHHKQTNNVEHSATANAFLSSHGFAFNFQSDFFHPFIRKPKHNKPRSVAPQIGYSALPLRVCNKRRTNDKHKQRMHTKARTPSCCAVLTKQSTELRYRNQSKNTKHRKQTEMETVLAHTRILTHTHNYNEI